MWLFLMSGLFIGVMMAFPDGLAGLVEQKLKPWWAPAPGRSQGQAERIKAAQPCTRRCCPAHKAAACRPA
ncbi:MAG: hypothetical protein QM749_08585 [Aquabacterium sp.]